MEHVSPARKAAFKILRAIESGQAHSDDLLRGRSVSALSPQDRHLATTLVLGVLRWQLELDQHVRPLLKHPNAKLDTDVLIALRLGTFQILHLDRIPARAAIDESVELTKQAGHKFASAMVNAVLRKMAAQPRESMPSSSNLPREVQAYPAWMRDRWETFFGTELANTICRHGQSQPALALRLKDSSVEAELVKSDIRLASGALLTHTRIVESGDITATDAFREGRVRIQDEGSQLVAEIAGQGTHILDCCAAPGGKTLILAERNPDARIVACESSPQRLEAMRNRFLTHTDRIECRLADATMLTDESAYDLVLADVPCSGTGTLGRNPEIRHRLRPEEIARQAERQIEILTRVLQAAQPGGRVIYSTCSLEPEENEQVVFAVLLHHENARSISLGARMEEMSASGILAPEVARKLQASLTPEGYLRLIPGVFGTDGFFIALLEKSESPAPHAVASFNSE